ncbi:hypothetical protein OFD51_30650, partial [Escherichia coli]|nr:hypothetical protein [Escherichia coli]
NFFGWFATGAIIFALFGHRWPRRGWAHFAGASVMLFFALIAASRGYIVPCALGLALVGFAAWQRFFGGEEREARDEARWSLR